MGDDSNSLEPGDEKALAPHAAATVTPTGDAAETPETKTIRIAGLTLKMPSGSVILRRVVWSVIVAASGALGTALFSIVWQHFVPQTIDYEVDVRQDAQTGTPMQDVDVDLGINGAPLQKTNYFGKAVFSNLGSHFSHKHGPIKLHKEGFKSLTPIDSSLENNTSPVVVVMVADATPSPTVKPLNKTSAPESPKDLNAIPPSSSPQTLVKTYSSGPQISGVGADNSPWYTLCSDPVASYHVVDSNLVLTGDRVCNQWSECMKDAEKSSSTVSCWKFRMQGHSEALRLFGPSGSAQAYSTGVLTVTLVKD
ncbi:hypothetical protein [Granulicella sp. L60]|uniref:hypothetical protein n=1 Tax=Granulicella sp. L60 TaxID=1641866 RepID=UPI00131AAED2|nr:hypothetical protein [Granulicella sp. L60]